MFSWRDFLEEYLDPSDSRNVGLHEMAHALRWENMIKNVEYGFFNWDDIDAFNDHTVIKSNKINAVKNHFSDLMRLFTIKSFLQY